MNSLKKIAVSIAMGIVLLGSTGFAAGNKADKKVKGAITKEDIVKIGSTPLTATPSPLVPHRFNRREYMYIYYRTDKEALRRVLPDQFELPETPIVRFEMMKMPDTTGLGDYTECGQAIPCSFNGQEGDYLLMMYVDNFEAIVSGREIHAYPKKLGWPKMFVDDNTLIGTLDYGKDFKFRVANATMDYKYKAMPKEEAIKVLTDPAFMLKMTRGYDGKLTQCELTRMINPKDKIEIIEAWTGDARLELFDHVKCPLGDLPVLEIVKAEHIICNITLGRPEVIYDYLTDTVK